jgi:hypothetical protein
VEAQWQQVLAKYPYVNHFNVTWCTNDDFDRQLPDYAAWLDPELGVRTCDYHQHTEHDPKVISAFNDSVRYLPPMACHLPP